MNVIQIQAKNATLSIACPESWDSLDDRTALLFYETLFNTPGDDYTRTAFTMTKLISMMMLLLDVDKQFLDDWAASCRQKDAELGEDIFLEELKQVVTAALAGLFDIEQTADSGTTYAIRNNRTRNLWPIMLGMGARKRAFFAPANGLENITLYELAAAFTYYEQFLADGNESTANMLLATLYRPTRPRTKEEVESGWGGDRRQRLRGYESKITERAELIGELPSLMRRFLVFWFASCRQAIVDAYPKVFRPGSAEKTGPDYGWGGVLLALAGGPVGLDAISDQHHGNGLTWLSMKADEAEEAERRMEEARR